MENCGSCKHYVNNPVTGPSCRKTGKLVSYLNKAECWEAPGDDAPVVLTKVCNRCHRELPLTMFSRNHTRKDGYQCQCKDCQRELSQDLYSRRKAKFAEADAEEPQPPKTTKVCAQCGRELPIENFGTNKRATDGHKSYCRDCENENCRKYRAKKYGRQGKPNPKPKKEKPLKVTEPVITPKPIPITELTFEKFMQSFMAYGGVTIKIQISKTQDNE